MNREPLLLVEDDATTREVLTLLLELDGWEVSAAESGEIALQMLGKGETAPDLILCDLRLPGIQGAPLADALREVAPNAGRFAMSASEASAAERVAYDVVLQKPLAPADVRAAWEQWRAGASSGSRRVGMAQSGASTTREENDLAVIAPATLLKLEQQMGARAKDLYAFALADAGDRLKRLQTSLSQGDDGTFRKEAHALKGSAGMIGAQRLAALAAIAETTPVVSSGGSLDETVRQMYLACEEIRLMLETLFPI
ncbi:response regulator [Terriglobus aquaticus]|uniref:Response regulator n=1 Tax=Terriglobus aquaticus TaxID=940139 RepID=A0ABW9KN80_9BACT|nr:response regulator [Terriglobus aquaticus]